jgi:LCP family protein required for cell wall assembly
MAAAASTFVPGLGQLLNGRARLAKWFALPILLLAIVGFVAVSGRSPSRLVASIVAPGILSVLLALNAAVLVWRLVAVGHAFFDRRYSGRPGALATIGIVVLLAAVAAPHLVLNSWGSTAQASFASVFTNNDAPKDPLAAPVDRGPGIDERLNLLLVAIDKTPDRPETLTDSMMVVSVDPIGNSVTMLSLPRDMVGVPLGNGEAFLPKLNSLMTYAEEHPQKFPDGGMRALQDAVGAMLGIRIHNYVKVDFFGFVKLVDAIGGVDVDVTRAFYDPLYDGLGVNPKGVRGWGADVGLHHFNGWEAIAYSRTRRGVGESDFTRAARQQEILLAIRDKLVSDPGLMLNVPALFDAFDDLVQTDVPPALLPGLAALAEEVETSNIVRVVLRRPLVKGGTDPVYGSVQRPSFAAILKVAATLFPPAGIAPIPWPTPASSQKPS